MERSIDKIKDILIAEFKELYSIEVSDFDKNLLASDIKISNAEFLYFFSDLYEKYEIDVYKIIATSNSDIMTINKLAEEISKKHNGK